MVIWRLMVFMRIVASMKVMVFIRIVVLMKVTMVVTESHLYQAKPNPADGAL